MARISLYFFLRQSILARFAASQSMPSITSKSVIFTTIKTTLRVWSATIAWSLFTLSLVTTSTLSGLLADHTYHKGSNSNPVSDPSRGGLSSASPRPLSLIGGHPLPHLTLSHGLGSMVLETKIASLKSKAHYL